VLADGLLKAARLALDNGEQIKAADLARQAYALDPARMHQDRSVCSLYLLAQQGPMVVGQRVNNSGPECRCPHGCKCKPPCLCVTKQVVVWEPSTRPNLPGVDPRVVAAMEKVLAEAEAKRPRLVVVVEEEQEPRMPMTSVEIAEPFVLGTAKAVKVFRSDMEMMESCGMSACAGWLDRLARFRVFAVPVTDPETKCSKLLTYTLLGWRLEEMPPAEGENE
jgi:hypothetical protein